jgi:hypothetical protein
MLSCRHLSSQHRADDAYCLIPKSNTAVVKTFVAYRRESIPVSLSPFHPPTRVMTFQHFASQAGQGALSIFSFQPTIVALVAGPKKQDRGLAVAPSRPQRVHCRRSGNLTAWDATGRCVEKKRKFSANHESTRRQAHKNRSFPRQLWRRDDEG